MTKYAALFRPTNCRPATCCALLRLQRVRLFGERTDKFPQAWSEKHYVLIIVSKTFMLIDHYIPKGFWFHAIHIKITRPIARERYISSRKLGCLIDHHYIGLFEAWYLNLSVHGIEIADIICLSILDEKSRARS